MKSKTKNEIRVGAVILILTIMLFGCNGGKTQYMDKDQMVTIIYDSCEYIYINTNGPQSLTHKGNCKFCEERLDKRFNKMDR